MWKVNFKIEEVKKWIATHRESMVLSYKRPILLPITPFEIEISPSAYDKIENIYINNGEKGGIIFCEVIKTQDSYRLKTIDVCEVDNVFESTPDNPGRSKANTYQPDEKQYLSLLAENFSNEKNFYFPIHFHTHPTANAKEFVAYSNSYTQLNTSDGDKNAAIHRFAEFGQVKLRYLSAIITGHDDELKIIFYAPGVTPLDFFSTKLDRIKNKLSNFGEKASTLTDDDKLKPLVKAGVELVGTLFVGFNMGTIDYIPLMFEEKEYFGNLDKNSSTIIKIPKYKAESE